MAATAGVAIPIKVYKTQSTGSGMAQVDRKAEKLTQTFLIGTPVNIDSGTGFLQACPAIVSVATAVIAGISTENGSNLTASGVAKTLNLPNAPQNQSAAIITPYGAPANDGTCGFAIAMEGQYFVGILGGSVTDADGTSAQTDIGAIFGLTKDATTKYWYVDKDITTLAAGACVEVVDFVDAVGTLHGKVVFKILKGAQQLAQ